jgi:predicted GH43/DUF377 family glycosyl hydrolase
MTFLIRLRTYGRWVPRSEVHVFRRWIATFILVAFVVSLLNRLSLANQSLGVKRLYLNSALFLTVALAPTQSAVLLKHKTHKTTRFSAVEKMKRFNTYIYFNPSIMSQQDGAWLQVVEEIGTSTRFLLAFRRAYSQWGPSDIMAVFIDHSLDLVNGSLVELSLSSRAGDENWFGTPWNEDPRLFLIDGDLGLSYTVVSAFGKEEDGIRHKLWQRQAYMVLNTSLTPYLKDILPAINNNIGYPTYPDFEKNWGFFDYDGDLCAVYTIQPFVIYCKIRRLAEKVIEVDWKHPLLHSTELRGGTPPVRLDDFFYAFVHSVGYDIYVIRFSARNLNLTDYSLHPVLSFGDVLFPCGAVFIRKEQMWLIATGVDDIEMHIMKLAHSRVVGAMHGA